MSDRILCCEWACKEDADVEVVREDSKEKEHTLWLCKTHYDLFIGNYKKKISELSIRLRNKS